MQKVFIGRKSSILLKVGHFWLKNISSRKFYAKMSILVRCIIYLTNEVRKDVRPNKMPFYTSIVLGQTNAFILRIRRKWNLILNKDDTDNSSKKGERDYLNM